MKKGDGRSRHNERVKGKQTKEKHSRYSGLRAIASGTTKSAREYLFPCCNFDKSEIDFT